MVMTKNEIVARFMGWKQSNGTDGVFHIGTWYDQSFNHYKKLSFSSDRNWLHEAWVKFRDLKFDFKSKENYEHHQFKTKVLERMGFGTITEAFDELVKGIEWYESLNK